MSACRPGLLHDALAAERGHRLVPASVKSSTGSSPSSSGGFGDGGVSHRPGSNHDGCPRCSACGSSVCGRPTRRTACERPSSAPWRAPCSASTRWPVRSNRGGQAPSQPPLFVGEVAGYPDRRGPNGIRRRRGDADGSSAEKGAPRSEPGVFLWCAWPGTPLTSSPSPTGTRSKNANTRWRSCQRFRGLKGPLRHRPKSEVPVE